MVWLHLDVTIFPREQAPSSGSLSAALQSTENVDQNGPNDVSLLLSIAKPEECTVAHLAFLINEEWSSTFPNSAKLEIKKLLLIDDKRPAILLRHNMSVAQIWVNRGKARADGWDQYGAVGVIQKPSTAPQRFPSVDPEFEHAFQAERKRLSSRVSPILEEPESELPQIAPEYVEASGETSEIPRSEETESLSRNVPLSSVEADTAIATPHTPSNSLAQPLSSKFSNGATSSARKASNAIYIAKTKEAVIKKWGAAKTEGFRHMMDSYKTSQIVNKLLKLKWPYNIIQLSINQQITARLKRRSNQNQKGICPVDLKNAAEVSNPLPLDPLLMQELGLGFDPDGFLGDEKIFGPFPNSCVTNSTSKIQRQKRKANEVAEYPPAKEPRLETDQAQSQMSELSDEHQSSSPRRRRIPTFASARRPIRSKPINNGLGLDVRNSPKACKTSRPFASAQREVPLSPLMPIPSSALSAGKSCNPDRHVSFTDNMAPQKSPETCDPSSHVSVPQNSQASTVVYPPSITKEKIRQIEETTRERETLIQEATSMAENGQTDTLIIPTVQSIRSLDSEIQELKNLDPKERKLRARYVGQRKDELDALLDKFRNYKADLENAQMMDIDSEPQAELESSSSSESPSSGSGSGSGSDGDESSDGEEPAKAANKEVEDMPHEPANETAEATMTSDSKDEEMPDADSEEDSEKDPASRKKASKNMSQLSGMEADDSPADDEKEDHNDEDGIEEDSDEEEDGDDESSLVSSSEARKNSNIADEVQDQVTSPGEPAEPAKAAEETEKQDTSRLSLSQRAAALQADLEAPQRAPPLALKPKEDDSSSSSSSSSSDSELDPILGYGLPEKPKTSIFDRPPRPKTPEPISLAERAARASKITAELLASDQAKKALDRALREQEVREQRERERKAREQRERKARQQREQKAREQREQKAREQREQKAREQEALEQETRDRQLGLLQPEPGIDEPVLSEAESISDMGDFLPNGTWTKIRRPRAIIR